jgi:hypothetical protein
MNPSYLETFRRHRALFTLVILLAFSLATWASLGQPTLYRSSASLWSDTPTGAATAFGAPPPAAQEQTLLNELLTTEFFRSQVAQGSGLAAYLETNPTEGWGPTVLLGRLRSPPSLDDRIEAALGPKRVTLLVQGPHVLRIDFEAASPTLALETLNALVKTFREQRLVLRRDALAASRQRVERAADVLEKARRELTDYLRDADATASDGRLRQLTETERDAVLQVAAATETLNAETRDVLSGTSGEATLRVIDRPRLPMGSTSGKVRVATAGLAGFFVGTILSILGVVALTRTDRRGRQAPSAERQGEDDVDTPDRGWAEAERVAAETIAARRSRLEQRAEQPQ